MYKGDQSMAQKDMKMGCNEVLIQFSFLIRAFTLKCNIQYLYSRFP